MCSSGAPVCGSGQVWSCSPSCCLLTGDAGCIVGGSCQTSGSCVASSGGSSSGGSSSGSSSGQACSSGLISDADGCICPCGCTYQSSLSVCSGIGSTPPTQPPSCPTNIVASTCCCPSNSSGGSSGGSSGVSSSGATMCSSGAPV